MGYQLTYNGHQGHPICATLKEAELFKERAALQWPDMAVGIIEITGGDNETDTME